MVANVDTSAQTKANITIPRAAEILGVGRSTVYSLISAGDLKRVRIGRRALITGESLRSFQDRIRAGGSDGA